MRDGRGSERGGGGGGGGNAVKRGERGKGGEGEDRRGRTWRSERKGRDRIRAKGGVQRGGAHTPTCTSLLQ